MKLSFFIPILSFIGVVLLTGCTQHKVSQPFVHSIPASIDTNLVLPPAWAFGVLYGGYTNQEGTIRMINDIKAHHYPIDAYWIDSWFWSFNDQGIGPHKFIDFVADTVSYPNRQQMWSYMEENNIKGGFWIWDCIQQTGNEEAYADFEKKGYFSNVYMNTNPWHNKSTSTAMNMIGSEQKGTPTGNINFDNPEAVAYFKTRMKHFFDEGADFIKLDRTSKISVCKTMFEMSQEFGKETEGRGFVISHTGGMETKDYKKYPTKWTDDTRSDWNIENPLKEFNSWVPYVAFKENIEMYTDTTKQSSKIPFLTNDLGGFDMGITDQLDEELYIRWLQFSLFCPVTEVLSQPENSTSNLAWKYSDRADSIFRFYANLRMQLFPYLYTYAHLSRLTSTNMIRKIPGQLHEFLLGNEMLVAPVIEKGATTKKVFLPKGNWLNYWSGEKYEGETEIIVSALIEQIPLFVRQGAIIPMRKYASSIEKGNNDTIYLHVYPGTKSTFKMIEDDGISNDYINGIYASTIIELNDNSRKINLKINPLEGNYKGMSLSRKWILNIHCNQSPKQIRMNRQNVKFSYNKEVNVVILETPQLPVKQLLDFEIIKY